MSKSIRTFETPINEDITKTMSRQEMELYMDELIFRKKQFIIQTIHNSFKILKPEDYKDYIRNSIKEIKARKELYKKEGHSVCHKYWR